jgi:hypothetical protein
VWLLEGAEVAANALDVAGEPQLAHLVVELGDVVAALAPPLVQVGLVLVQDRGPVGGLDQEFVEAARAGEAADGGVVQPQLVPDGGQGLALGGEGPETVAQAARGLQEAAAQANSALWRVAQEKPQAREHFDAMQEQFKDRLDDFIAAAHAAVSTL